MVAAADPPDVADPAVLRARECQSRCSSASAVTTVRENIGCRYLGLVQAYNLADEPGHGAEVFSLILDSDLPATDYVTAFFDTGSERQGAAP